MRGIRSIITSFLCLMFLMAAVSMSTAGGQENHERQKLLERQRRLEARIDKLKLEQDFLLFQRSVYTSDSKYLVLKIKEKKGQLKYKEKTLKDFRFRSASSARAIKQGAVTVTKKSDGRSGPRMLVFGNSLVIQGRSGAPVRFGRTAIPRISLGRKDLISVVNAMGEGGKAYIIP